MLYYVVGKRNRSYSIMERYAHVISVGGTAEAMCSVPCVIGARDGGFLFLHWKVVLTHERLRMHFSYF